MSEVKLCTVDGCESRVLAKGLCSVHYDRKRRYGATDLPQRTKDTKCIDCEDRDALYRVDGGGVCQRCKRRRERAVKPQPQPLVCAHCGQPFTPKRNYSAESGRGVFCSRACKEKERTADGRAAEAVMKSLYKTKYGLTIEEVAALRSQGCSICGTEDGQGRWGNLHIDHDHVTGTVRGGLCNNCNLGIGKFRDDPNLLEAAAAYLRNPPGPPNITG